MKRLFLILVLMVSLAGISQAQTPQLVKLWETDSSFKVPESVCYDASAKVLYVSNIEGKDPWEKDGAGSISKLGTDGKMIALDWITGLNAPKGMAVYKNRLYVADLTDLVIIDIKNSKIEQRVPIDGAQGLNDVSAAKNGTIYISDSRGKKVYTYKSGKAEVYLPTLQGPNGVLAHGDNLYVLDQGKMFKVGKDRNMTMIAEGMEGGTDGIEHVKGNEYIVSCWAGAIWYVSGPGKKDLLLDTRDLKINSADIGWDVKNRIVYVPTFWKNTVVAYQLK